MKIKDIPKCEEYKRLQRENYVGFKRHTLTLFSLISIATILCSAAVIVHNIRANKRIDRLTERVERVTEAIYRDSINLGQPSAPISTPSLPVHQAAYPRE